MQMTGHKNRNGRKRKELQKRKSQEDINSDTWEWNEPQLLAKKTTGLNIRKESNWTEYL
jgi:hypothetical protein